MSNSKEPAAQNKPLLPPCDGWPRYLTGPQVCFALDLTPKKLEVLVKMKVLPAEHLAGETYVEAEPVRALVAIRRLLEREAA